MFDELSYIDFINKRLGVMDTTAITMCMEHKLPILVLNLWDESALKAALFGEKVGTLVH
jgi:uridylate kinase